MAPRFLIIRSIAFLARRCKAQEDSFSNRSCGGRCGKRWYTWGRRQRSCVRCTFCRPILCFSRKFLTSTRSKCTTCRFGIRTIARMITRVKRTMRVCRIILTVISSQRSLFTRYQKRTTMGLIRLILYRMIGNLLQFSRVNATNKRLNVKNNIRMTRCPMTNDNVKNRFVMRLNCVFNTSRVRSHARVPSVTSM